MLIIGALLMGTALTMVAIPPILRVARAKHLFEPFDPRKVNKQVVPPLEGC